jgi:hypothetical protein
VVGVDGASFVAPALCRLSARGSGLCVSREREGAVGVGASVAVT